MSIISFFKDIAGARRIPVTKGELARDPHLNSDGECYVPKAILNVVVADAGSGETQDITRSVYNPARALVTGNLKVTDVNVQDRYMGELLLEDDLVSVDGGVAVAGEAFNTRGYQYLFVTIINPIWATNPTALNVTLQVSCDAFDTQEFILIARDGVQIVQTLQFADEIQQAFFMPVMSNVGTPAATAVPFAAPIPDIDDMTARLVFTPTGAGVTNEGMIVNVYGITSR